MSATLRNATAADKSRCLELLAVLAGKDPDPAAGTAFDTLLDCARGEILVADEDGIILGMATISYNIAMRYGGEYCQLEELIVDPTARGKNLGELLVQGTLARARTRGCAEYGLYLVESTEHNRDFYARYGMEAVGTEMRQRLT